MKVRILRVAVSALLGAAVAMLLYIGFLGVRFLLRHGTAWAKDEPLLDLIEETVIVGAAGALVAALSTTFARRYYQHAFAKLAGHVAELQQNPAPHAVAVKGVLASSPELKGVCNELDRLVACYRQALADVVRIQEKLDLLETPNGQSVTVLAERNRIAPSRYSSSSRIRMVARLAPNLHWIAATPPLLKFLGTTTTHLVARSFLDIVHPEDVPILRRALQEALKDGEGHNILFRVLIAEQKGPLPQLDSDPEFLIDPANPPAPPTIRERHFQMDVMTCYNDAGTPVHLRCHLLDITDRIRTEQELRRRTDELSLANARLRQINVDLARLKESYRDLYHHAPELYFGLDPRGHFVAFNESMLRALGYPREALLGQPYTRLLPPESREAFLRHPEMFQQPGQLETQWLKQDGTIIDVWISTTTILDEKAQFARSRSVARDMTERNRLAKELRAKADEVEAANVQLRRVNQELEEFTYVVSHDLKEPLRTIEAFSKFLEQDYGKVLGAEGHGYIDHLIQGSRRLGRLIDDLLMLGRAGRVINTPHAFNWDTTIRPVLDGLHDLIQRKQAVVHVEGPLPPVVGDPERVMQVLANLVTNALRYNKSSQPEVVIGALADANGSDNGQAFATLFVRDNGIGIEPQYHQQIFRMFRRLHRREEVEGTGAGLAICQRIVEAHGGRIWVESELGKGATFFFTLLRMLATGPRTPTTKVALEARRNTALAPERAEPSHDQKGVAAS
jgi:PAS domain S-box-containing protein